MKAHNPKIHSRIASIQQKNAGNRNSNKKNAEKTCKISQKVDSNSQMDRILSLRTTALQPFHPSQP